jgi:hypothetical protein
VGIAHTTLTAAQLLGIKAEAEAKDQKITLDQNL